MAIRKVGKFWQIDYYDPAGKRIRQNFKKKKDAVAEHAAAESLKNEDHSKNAVIVEKLKGVVDGRYTFEEKREYDTTLGQAIEIYKKNFGHQPSFKTAKWIFIRHIKEYFGTDTPLSEIRFVHLETFRSHLRQTPTYKGTLPQDSTLNKTMSCLRHILKKSVEWELIEQNPFSRGGSLLLKENNQRLRYLTEYEITRLLDACSTKLIEYPNGKSRLSQMTRRDEKYLREIVECALNSGMRKGEILSLKWNQVRNGFIYLRKTKTSNPRQIPINDDLDALFKRIRQRQGLKSAYVFLCDGKGIEDVKSSFSAALKRAGIDDFTFHDLRHTFSSHFVMRGGDLKALQEILGHTTLTMTMKYAHLAQGHKKEAINRLNGLTTKKADGHKMVTFSETQNVAIS
jgi:integrase